MFTTETSCSKQCIAVAGSHPASCKEKKDLAIVLLTRDQNFRLLEDRKDGSLRPGSKQLFEVAWTKDIAWDEALPAISQEQIY